MTARSLAALGLLGAGALAAAWLNVADRRGPPGFLADPFGPAAKRSVLSVEGGPPGEPGWFRLEVERYPCRDAGLFRAHAETLSPTMLRTLLVQAGDDVDGSGLVEEDEIHVLAEAPAERVGEEWVAMTDPVRLPRAYGVIRILWRGEGGEEFWDSWGTEEIRSAP